MKDPKDVFYNDVSQEVAEHWIAQFKPQSITTFSSTVDSVAWESGLVPCTYMMCEQDNGLYHWLQQQMLDAASKESPKPWKVVKTNSSHSAWLTQIPTVVRLIEDAAGA